MTQQPHRPTGPALNLRGAVDLSSLAARPAPARGVGASPAGAGPQNADAAGDFPVVQVSEDTFGALVQRSATVPVVIDLGSPRSPASQQLTSTLETLAAEYGGRFLLAQVDVDAFPQIAQAFQVTAVPAACAVLAGQPLPLFQGAPPAEQLRQVLDELLTVAASNGITGRVEAADGAPDDQDATDEEELPPLHQLAYEAIERDDLDGALAAYEQALTEEPTDEMASAGRAQVRLLVRTRGADLPAARAAAAAAPTDVPAQLLAADLDVLDGHVEDAFTRLVDTVRRTAGADRVAARTHLLELFTVVGGADPRVAKARTALANTLF